MCYRTKLNAKIREIEKTFDAPFIDSGAYTPKDEINAFDFSRTPVITDENPREINMLNWGLIPFWAKNDMIKKATLNAKIETATEKPAFRNSVGNRCLSIMSGSGWILKENRNKNTSFNPQTRKYLLLPEYTLPGQTPPVKRSSTPTRY